MSRPLGEDDSRSIPVAVPIILAKPDHKFELNVRALERILLRDDVKDRCVVVLSVAGTFRKGKSFLLDFFLRYVESEYCKVDNKSDWMGSPNEPLVGFPWRGGSERDTAGILMWSEVFLTTLPGNQKVAILFLDTQGTFDSDSTVKDCATIFALSTMISSIQIYNLSQNIQEDDLQHLQLFTEYGRLALADSGEKPFQKLQLLVRDWSYPYEAPYGVEGGKTVLEKRLKISEKQHPELQSIRNHVRSCFKEICCFLLPHPGLKVATDPNFNGRLSDIEPEFLKYIREFVPLLMSPKYLTLKAINGQQVKAKELLQYFKSYINIYGGDDLPEPKSLLLATAEANNLAAVAAAKEVYHSKMEAICGGDKAFLSSNALEAHHLTIKTEVLHDFSKKKKMGGSEFSENYKTKLEMDIDTMYTEFQLHNNSKNVFKTARTPSVYFVVILVSYLASGIFDIIGIAMLVFVCNLSLALSMVTLVTWTYCRYTGELTEVSQAIDNIAGGIWEEVMKPVYQKVTGKMVERMVESAVPQSTRPLTTTHPKA